MSGSEIVLFLLGFVLGAGSLVLLTKIRKKDDLSAQDVFKQQFELLAHQIFDEKSRRLDETTTKNLSQILDPLKERLKDFEKKVEDTYSLERSERGVLKGELNKLLELNQCPKKLKHCLVP